VPFSRELYIEQDDFMEDAPKKFFRLSVGREVRLRYAYFITCNEAIKNDAGEIVELHCTYDPETKGGNAPDGRKVKATMHWVSLQHAVKAEVRLYDHLFNRPDPGADGDFLDDINPDSLTVLDDACLEPSLVDFKPGENIQFERLGYFTPDYDSSADKPIFNRTVALRDAWAKIQKKG
jgi:glutaminyl-tRNA synthetase